jgi:signal transduction histidine kinase
MTMAVLPATLPRRIFARARVERVIATVRVVIAASTLFAVWMDPAEPARHVQFTYTLHVAYLAYALMLVAIMWRRNAAGPAALVTHVGDILIVSVLQYLTLGPSSPFFTYFVYALFAAALRWGWQGTIRTAAFVLLMYIVMGVSISWTLGPSEFELDRFIIRTVYLGVIAVTLVYLGQHEAWLREEIQRLADWPVPPAADWVQGVPRILEHAAGIAGANTAVLIWNLHEEPSAYVVSWPAGAAISKYPPGGIDPIVAAPLGEATLLWTGHPSTDDSCVVNMAGVVSEWRGRSVHPSLLALLDGRGLVSAPFRTNALSGRVFFSGIAAPHEEIIPIAEVLGREIGATLEHLHSYDRTRQLAVAEERIRVARNLHDGVLQSLTGIRLELRRMAAQERQSDTPIPVGDRLLAIERALSLEQRELRFFIEDLKPALRLDSYGTSLSAKLEELRRRLALEWRTPITIRVSPEELTVPGRCDDAVPLIVHEAVVNALKHGKPSRVSVDVRANEDTLRIVVSDDGVGFPFIGRWTQAALIAENAGPVSLRERAASLGGEIAIESSPSGASVELWIPLGAAHA